MENVSFLRYQVILTNVSADTDKKVFVKQWRKDIHNLQWLLIS